jgi:hypothetical protein
MMILGPITFHPLFVIARLVRVMTAMEKTVQLKIIMP